MLKIAKGILQKRVRQIEIEEQIILRSPKNNSPKLKSRWISDNAKDPSTVVSHYLCKLKSYFFLLINDFLIHIRFASSE